MATCEDSASREVIWLLAMEHYIGGDLYEILKAARSQSESTLRA